VLFIAQIHFLDIVVTGVVLFGTATEAKERQRGAEGYEAIVEDEQPTNV
jgi:hypothetical protein